jgi:hypothetical protein
VQPEFNFIASAGAVRITRGLQASEGANTLLYLSHS